MVKPNEAVKSIVVTLATWQRLTELKAKLNMPNYEKVILNYLPKEENTAPKEEIEVKP